MGLAAPIAEGSLFPRAMEQRGGEGESPQAVITMRCGEVQVFSTRRRCRDALDRETHTLLLV